jgi:CHASE3 domain sensor protein
VHYGERRVYRHAVKSPAAPASHLTPVAPRPRSRAWLPLPAFIALIAAVLAVFVIAWLTYRALAARADAANAVNHTNAVQDHLHRFLSQVKDAETAQRGFLLTGVERYLEPYELAQASITTELQGLRQATADNPAQQQELGVVTTLVSLKLDELAQTIAHKRSGDTPGALAIVDSDRGRLLMERLRQSIDAMLATEQRLLVQRTDEWEATVSSSSYVMFGGVGVLLCMILLIGVLASRDFRAVEAEGWVRRVHLALTSQLQGDLRLESIGDKVLRILVENFHARVGAVYVAEPDVLRRIAGHALASSGEPAAVIKLG